MELPRIVHDELLHKVDAPQEQHLVEVMHAAEVHEPVTPNKESSAKQPNSNGTGASSERSPLLKPSPSGRHVVVVDIEKVEAILTAEEQEAIAADAKMRAWDIVGQESVILVRLVIPMIMTVLLDFLPDIGLTMMIGHVDPAQSTQNLAAFQLSGLYQTLLVLNLLNGISFAIDTLCSQAFGAKKMTELWLFCQAGFLIYAMCMPFMVVAVLSGSYVLKALGQDPAISDIAGQFLLIYTLVIPFGVLFSVLKSAVQAQNIVYPFVTSSLASWLISGTTAYLLAFHTPLGYLGVVMAIPLWWIVKSLWLIPVVLSNEVFQSSWPGWKPKEAMALVPKISKLGVSSVLMVTFQMLGFSFISLLAGLLPNAGVMIAANGIFVSITVLTFIPLLGISIGGAVRIGNALGAGKARRAALIGWIVMISSVVVSSICMVVTIFIAPAYASAFTPESEVIEVAVDLTLKVLPIIPLLGFSYGIQSIFRACGKQLLAAKFNFVCMFVLGVPMGLFFALKLDAGLAGLWVGNMAGLFVFMLAGLVWLYGLSWEKLAHEAKHNTSLHFVQTPPVVEAF